MSGRNSVQAVKEECELLDYLMDEPVSGRFQNAGGQDVDDQGPEDDADDDFDDDDDDGDEVGDDDDEFGPGYDDE